jgi:hypothetical protein
MCVKLYNSLPIHRLHELFFIRANQLFWRISPTSTVPAGSKAGRYVRGYLVVGIEGTEYKVHRVIWAMSKGEWPKQELDHKNGVCDDNRMSNLREVTHAQNLQNRGTQRNNTSGAKGVTWHRAASKWRAEICADGKYIYLGLFSDLRDAENAYNRAAARYHSGAKYNVST